MGSLLHSLSAVFVILILTACGYICSVLGWVRPDAKAFISKYLMGIAIPVMCIYGLRTNLTLSLLRSSGKLLLVSAVLHGFLFLLSLWVGRILRLPSKTRSVFVVMCTVSNAMLIGYPMCLELFGEEAIPFVMVFFLANAAFAQLVGIPMIQRSGGQQGLPLGKILLNFFSNPCVIAILLGFFLILIDWTPPALVMNCARYISNTVTPLGLLLAGHIVHEIGLRRLRMDRTLALCMMIRFLVSSGLCLLLCAIFGVTGLERSVVTALAAMPALTQSVVAAAEYGADEQLGAKGVTLSTLACFVVIPVLMLLL